jgi:hypothetical protein
MIPRKQVEKNIKQVRKPIGNNDGTESAKNM